MFNDRVTVVKNEKINEAYWKLTFRSPKIAKASKPGHFVNLLVAESFEPFLRRPFSIYRIKKDEIDLLYEVVGHGTFLMSHLRKGDRVDVLGPLGRTFRKPAKRTLSILVGGGVGIVPLAYWDEVLGADYLVMGHRNGTQVLPLSELKNKKSKKFISTNDGSAGKKGFVTDVLKTILEKEKGKSAIILTCGPTVMMHAVQKMANDYGIPGELSVEENMACGVGACLGCVVLTTDGYKASCVDGPVFSFEEVPIS